VRISQALGAAAAVVIATSLVSGCGQSQAGAAITFDGGRISEQTVAAQAREVADQLEIAVVPGVTQATIQRLASNTLVDAGAEQLGIEITGGQVDDIISRAEAEVGGAAALVRGLAETGVPESQIRTQAEVEAKAVQIVDQLAPGTDGVARQEALADFLVEVSDDINLQVNPRFGQWNSEFLVVTPTPDLLSRPADNSFSVTEFRTSG